MQTDRRVVIVALKPYALSMCSIARAQAAISKEAATGAARRETPRDGRRVVEVLQAEMARNRQMTVLTGVCGGLSDMGCHYRLRAAELRAWSLVQGR